MLARIATSTKPALRLGSPVLNSLRRPVALHTQPLLRPSAQANSLRSYATYRSFNNSRVGPLDYLGLLYRHWKAVAVVMTAGGVFYYTHLERAPISNRRRFMVVSKAMEQAIGSEGYDEVLQQYGSKLLPEHHPQVLRVKRIMKNIIKVSGLDDLDWRVHVVNDPSASPNAFVLPSGKVFVFNTILPICGNDDGLATVLAHETAHQVARHTAENLSKAPIYMLVGLAIYFATGSRLLDNLITQSLLRLPASREMETEADFIGLMMMSRACYNPEEAVHVWERMSKFEQQALASLKNGAIAGMPEFLSTHPSSSRRIHNIQQWLPEANDARALAGCHDYSSYMPTFMEWAPPKIKDMF